MKYKTKTMKNLNLSIIRRAMPDDKWLSMDDYLKFVNLHLKYTFNRKANQQWKKLLAVNVPFFIK